MTDVDTDHTAATATGSSRDHDLEAYLARGRRLRSLAVRDAFFATARRVRNLFDAVAAAGARNSHQ